MKVYHILFALSVWLSDSQRDQSKHRLPIRTGWSPEREYSCNFLNGAAPYVAEHVAFSGIVGFRMWARPRLTAKCEGPVTT